MPTRRLLGSVLLSCGLLNLACGSAGAFTWFGDLPASEWSSKPGEYVIGVGDTLSIRVFDQENLSTRGKIRSDGRLALPFAGEIVAANKHPAALAREIEGRLKEFIVSPRVTVNVEDSVPLTVSVLGEVGSRGTISLSPPATLVQAIAQAGGPTEFADRDAIFVLRAKPTFRRIRFTYEALVKNQGGAATFPLRTGDVIVVQ